MNRKDLLEQATIRNLREEDDRGSAIDKTVSINNIKRSMYYESEMELFNKIYNKIKSVESYVYNWSIDFLGGKRAYVVFRVSNNAEEGEFQIDFNTDSGDITTIKTTYSSQLISQEFINLAQSLLNLK